MTKRNNVQIITVGIGVLLLAVVVFIVDHISYNNSVRQDVQTLSTLTSKADGSKRPVAFDRLAMSDELRVRQVERSYKLEVGRPCGRIYKPLWQLSPKHTICGSKNS